MRLPKVALLLATAWNHGCSSECAEQDVAFDLTLTSPAPTTFSDGISWQNTACLISTISGPNFSLRCDSLEEMNSTPFLTFAVASRPQIALPFAEGENVVLDFAQFFTSSGSRLAIRSPEGELLLAGQIDRSLPQDYRPLTITESRKDCGSMDHDCGRLTRLGLKFGLEGATVTVFDRQYAELPGFAIFLLRGGEQTGFQCNGGKIYSLFVVKN